MAEVTNELIYEVLRGVQSDIRQLKDGQSEIRHEIVAMRLNLVSIHQDLNNIYERLARHDERLDRIEHRLELRELAEKSQAPYTPPR
ncbi:MAG: hypothetical protein R3E51_14460 [Rhizobiaceae bacterium]|jgi:uncharacterized coiled-coil DUF342 family protein